MRDVNHWARKVDERTFFSPMGREVWRGEGK